MSGTQPAATDRWVDARARPAAAAGLTEVGSAALSGEDAPSRVRGRRPSEAARRPPQGARGSCAAGTEGGGLGEVGVVSLLPLVL